jgi:hypothetical protein
MKLRSAVDDKPPRFTSMPTRQNLRHTIFYSFLVLTLLLSSIVMMSARFGPLRGTFLDLYPVSSHAFLHAIQSVSVFPMLGFGVSWMASPDLRYRHRYLNLFAFLLAFLALAMLG